MNGEEIYRAIRAKTLANLAFAGKVAEKTHDCMSDWSRVAGQVGCDSEVCKHITLYEGALVCVRLLLDVMLTELEKQPVAEPVDELFRTVKM